LIIKQNIIYIFVWPPKQKIPLLALRCSTKQLDMAFRFIETSTSGIVQTFGKYTRTVGPGLRFYIPFVQKITHVSHRLLYNDFNYTVKTKNDTFARLSLGIQYTIKEENAKTAFFSLENPIVQMNSFVENYIRAKVPSMTLNELYSSQHDICETVSTNLKKKMEEYGYTIVTTLVTGVEPESQVQSAMNKVYASNMLKEAARNEADAKYIMEVRQAEADRDRKRLQGEGISAQRLAIMKGYQEGVSSLSQTLGIPTTEVMKLVLNTQHLDTLEMIGKAPNTKTLFMSHEVLNSPLLQTLLKAKES
jgi:regulator of protease activity HflC (stomatin/prohibitin superfamily)